MNETEIINKKILILENVRSVYNVGAIFRTADAIGIDKIFLVGYTPTPLDRFGRIRKDIHKAALGAEENIIWEHLSDLEAIDVIKDLKNNNFKVVAVEQDKKSLDYKKVSEKTNNEDIALILGNELEGVSKEILNLCDYVAELPMKGNKESLNVSVTAGIILYHFFDTEDKNENSDRL